FITFSRQYPQWLFPGKTQLDESANPIRESNRALIDSINPLSWWRTARALKRADPKLIVFNWWHPFFGLCYGASVQFLPRAQRGSHSVAAAAAAAVAPVLRPHPELPEAAIPARSHARGVARGRLHFAGGGGAL